jgi:hypothetical protein
VDVVRLTRRSMAFPTATLTHIAYRLFDPTPHCLIEDDRPAEKFSRFQAVPIRVPTDDRVAVLVSRSVYCPARITM